MFTNPTDLESRENYALYFLLACIPLCAAELLQVTLAVKEEYCLKMASTNNKACEIQKLQIIL